MFAILALFHNKLTACGLSYFLKLFLGDMHPKQLSVVLLQEVRVWLSWQDKETGAHFIIFSTINYYDFLPRALPAECPKTCYLRLLTWCFAAVRFLRDVFPNGQTWLNQSFTAGAVQALGRLTKLTWPQAVSSQQLCTQFGLWCCKIC